MTAVPPVTGVDDPEPVLLLPLLPPQPAATRASATAAPLTASILQLRSLNLDCLCCCGASPMAAAPLAQGTAGRQALRHAPTMKIQKIDQSPGADDTGDCHSGARRASAVQRSAAIGPALGRDCDLRVTD